MEKELTLANNGFLHLFLGIGMLFSPLIMIYTGVIYLLFLLPIIGIVWLRKHLGKNHCVLNFIIMFQNKVSLDINNTGRCETVFYNPDGLHILLKFRHGFFCCCLFSFFFIFADTNSHHIVPYQHLNGKCPVMVRALLFHCLVARYPFSFCLR